ncbi:thiolase domain-containing protein [Anaerolineales bacterium HSG6]|nr:thiolase domain-containing protein [Anaerolineales bacterium HSG6]MDM8532394.1 thiolase domain-containing protein [Anaerolineales bacterium HSG25]
MRDVSIIGIGQTPVGEHWDLGLRHLGYQALRQAMQDASVDYADALYVGNMLSGETSGQAHLGALIADFAGLRGIEAVKVEAACASAAAAFRQAYIGVASGLQDVVIAVGVEKMTDDVGSTLTAGLASAADADYEVIHGLSFVALNALLMQRYMYEYNVTREDFAGFALNAHANGVFNPNARFQKPITHDSFMKATMIADPITLLDASPMADGAAAVILCPTEQAREFTDKAIQIRGSAVATDSLSVHDRRDPLWLQAAEISSKKALHQANIAPTDLDFFELHDAFTIMAALSLESCGFVERGKGTWPAKDGQIALDGKLPITTRGGLKARGHPVGATGLYQIVEAVQQLRGTAGENQVPNARLGMTQNIGGSGATIITHILENNN